jgi:UDP-3-O-[3-hydroxymyristoyl] glucosamine N-acyltransferase
MRASLIAQMLGVPVVKTRDFEITGPCHPEQLRGGCVTMVGRPDEDMERLFRNAPADLVVIAPAGKATEASALPQVFFCVDRPRLAFCKVVNEMVGDAGGGGIDSTAVVGPGVVLGEGVSIGRWSVVEGAVEIGAGTRIGDRVSICGPAVIGERVHLKQGCVLGTRGFGFERDEDGIPVVFPHFGKVIIGNGVEIGANSTVARGSLSDTIIKDHTKIDELVHVGHNVFVDAGCLIASGTVLCGSVKLGKRVWIGPNATISNSLTVGDEAFVGIGAVVLDSVPAGVTVMARPAIPLRK